MICGLRCLCAGPTLDVDWRNSTCFASCSHDHYIYLCKLGEQEPLRRFEGHTGEINSIKWDPSGEALLIFAPPSFQGWQLHTVIRSCSPIP